MKYAAGWRTSLRSSPVSARLCGRPSTAVSPWIESDRDNAASRSFLDQRPSRPAFQTAVAGEELHVLDAGLAAAPALDHALHGLERVEVHRIGGPDADHQRLVDHATARQLDRRQPPRDRQR